MSAYSTGSVSDLLGRCDSIEELRDEILPLLQDQRAMWQNKIAEILSKTGYSCREFARLCQVSEPAVRKWRGGSLPQSRDMYLRIGFAAGYSLEEMNRFLMRWGRCPQLYAKSLEDSVCIFVLRSGTIPHTYAAYQELLELVRLSFQEQEPGIAATYSTMQMDRGLAELNSLEQMLAFVRSHAPAYRQSYRRLYSYVIAYLTINLATEDVGAGDRKASFHQLATEGNWSSSLRHCVSEIRRKRWFPQRNKIISLGLHLNMDDSAINEMLRLARMEPLYPKNPIECAILWAIGEARLTAEGASVAGEEILEDLSDFVKNILSRLDLADSEYLIDDL